jgi:hypothetical protein
MSFAGELVVFGGRGRANGTLEILQVFEHDFEYRTLKKLKNRSIFLYLETYPSSTPQYSCQWYIYPLEGNTSIYSHLKNFDLIRELKAAMLKDDTKNLLL